MPMAIAAAALSATVAGSWVAGGALILGFSMTSFIGSLVLSGLSMALNKKPKSGGISSSVGQSITQQFRQSLPARRMIFGEVRISGATNFIGSSGDNEFMHFSVMIASHEIESIGEIWIGEDSIAVDELDANGDVTSTAAGGKYYKDSVPYVRIKKFLGTSGQAACPELISAFPSKIDSNFKLSGIAYVYVRLKFSTDIFPSGIPNISVWAKGYKPYDTRTATSYWTPNSALVTKAHLTDSSLGIGIDANNFNVTNLESSANTCDEFVTTSNLSQDISTIDTATDIIKLVGTSLNYQTGDRVTVTTTGTLPAGISAVTNYYVIVYQRSKTVRIKLATSYLNALAGTAIDITGSGTGVHTVVKNAEPRYTCGGSVDSTTEPNLVIESILSSMSGLMLDVGGKWVLKAGAYSTPTLSFDESDLASGFQVQTKSSRSDRFNRIQGKYISPLNNGQEADYPLVKNSTYETQDGEVISQRIDLNFTQRPHTAMRLAKIILEKSRQEIIFSANFKLSAFKCQVGDNVLLSITRMGWTNKAFEVVGWKYNEIAENETLRPVIEMQLRETASTVYDWNNGEETAVDPAPNTTLPDIFTVNAVTGLRFDSQPVTTLNGDKIFRIILSWDAYSGFFVTEGGQFEIQYKLSTETAYKPSFFVAGNGVQSEIVQGSLNVNYDIRIRAVNNVGVKSGWATLTGVIAGSSGGVTSSEDWGSPWGSVASSEDYGTPWGSVSSSEDWGQFVS